MCKIRRCVPVFSLILVSISTTAAAGSPDARQLAERIDQLVSERWVKDGIRPARPSDDAEFLRRVYLDLTGRIPPVNEVRRFLADTAADKRSALVERLLKGPGYATHFATEWRILLAP